MWKLISFQTKISDFENNSQAIREIDLKGTMRSETKLVCNGNDDPGFKGAIL